MKSPERFRALKEHVGDTPVAIVYNPKSGKKGKEKYYWERTNLLVQKIEENLGVNVTVYRTESENHAQDIVGYAINEGSRLIGVKGGDGTLANLAKDLVPTEHNTHLLSLGGGRQNVLQTEIIKSRDPLLIGTESLSQGSPVQIDLGMITADSKQYFFLGNAGMGIDAYTLDEWEQSGKGSRMELFPIFWKNRNSFPTYDVTIKDKLEGIDKEHKDVIQMVFVNAGRYAGVFPITNSDMTDGVLEGIVLPASLKETKKFVRWIPNALLPGKKINGADYLNVQNTDIRESNNEEILFQHDGEPQRTGVSEINVSALQRAITLWVPDTSKAYAFRGTA